MTNRSLTRRLSGMLLASLVAVLALGIALPAQAHHADAKQNKKIKKLFNRTSQLSPDGWDFTGFVWSVGCSGPTDNAEFYQWEDTEFFWMECAANAPTAMSLDAQVTNAQREREARADELEEVLGES